MLEGLAVHELHDDKVLSIFFADVVNRADAGMIEGRGCFGFASKPLNRGGTLLGFLRKEFQRDHTFQTGIFCFVHHAHAATAQLLDDAVVRNDATDHKYDASLSRMLGCASSQVNASHYDMSSLFRNVPFLTSLEVSLFF